MKKTVLNSNKPNFRNGVLDYLLAFIIVFAFMITMIYLLVGYGSIVKVQNYLDIVTVQGSRILAAEGNQSAVVSMANALKPQIVATIADSNLTCSSTTGDRLVTLQVALSYSAAVLGGVNLNSTATAYNELVDQEINCILNIGVTP